MSVFRMKRNQDAPFFDGFLTEGNRLIKSPGPRQCLGMQCPHLGQFLVRGRPIRISLQ